MKRIKKKRKKKKTVDQFSLTRLFVIFAASIALFSTIYLLLVVPYFLTQQIPANDSQPAPVSDNKYVTTFFLHELAKTGILLITLYVVVISIATTGFTMLSLKRFYIVMRKSIEEEFKRIGEIGKAIEIREPGVSVTEKVAPSKLFELRNCPSCGVELPLGDVHMLCPFCGEKIRK